MLLESDDTILLQRNQAPSGLCRRQPASRQTSQSKEEVYDLQKLRI